MWGLRVFGLQPSGWRGPDDMQPARDEAAPARLFSAITVGESVFQENRNSCSVVSLSLAGREGRRIFWTVVNFTWVFLPQTDCFLLDWRCIGFCFCLAYSILKDCSGGSKKKKNLDFLIPLLFVFRNTSNVRPYLARIISYLF